MRWSPASFAGPVWWRSPWGPSTARCVTSVWPHLTITAPGWATVWLRTTTFTSSCSSSWWWPCRWAHHVTLWPWPWYPQAWCEWGMFTVASTGACQCSQDVGLVITTITCSPTWNEIVVEPRWAVSPPCSGAALAWSWWWASWPSPSAGTLPSWPASSIR